MKNKKARSVRKWGIVFGNLDDNLYQGVLYDTEHVKNFRASVIDENFSSYVQVIEGRERKLEDVANGLEKSFGIARKKYSPKKEVIYFEATMDQVYSIFSEVGVQIGPKFLGTKKNA